VQAYQSTPDMNQLYMRFAQQENADEGFNRGLGLLAASTYPGRHPEMIMNAMTGNTADPGALFGNIMKIQGWQQQQKQYQAFIDSAPDLAQRTGLTPNEVIAHGPDTINTALALGIGPEALRTRNAFKQQFITEHANDPDPANPGQKLGQGGAATLFDQQNPMSLTLAGAAGGGADPQRVQMQADLADWQRNNQGKTPPFNDVNSWQNWKMRTGQQTDDRRKAMQNFGDLDAGLTSYTNNLGNVAANPDLTNLVGSKVNEGKQYLPTGVPAAYGSLYPLHTQIKGLQDQANVLTSKAGPGTQTSLLGLNQDAANLTKYGLPEDNYTGDVISPIMKQALTAQANNYGASGQTDQMPGYLKPYLSDVYKQGGELYVSSGVKRSAPAAKPGAKPMGAKDMSDFQDYVEHYGPQRAIQQFKNEGFDTSSLE
jgi:hypothetical protein